jgi:hypothetical protein
VPGKLQAVTGLRLEESVGDCLRFIDTATVAQQSAQRGERPVGGDNRVEPGFILSELNYG